MKLPFIKLDRNASIIAVLAFLISITQLAVQVYRSSAYPRVEVLTPNQVYFVADFNPQNVKGETQLVAALVYYHPGSSSRNAVLLSQSASILIGDRKLRWGGQRFGRFELPNPRTGGKWTLAEQGALPVLIKPEEAVRTEALFAPSVIGNVERDFVSWDKFVSLFPKQKIRIRIDSEFAGRKHVFTEFDLHPPLYWYLPGTTVLPFPVVGSAIEGTELPGK